MTRIAVLIPLLALGAAPPEGPRPISSPAHMFSPTPKCRTLDIAAADKRVELRRLGELPPAEAYQAVLRLDGNGCLDPLLVSERIGWSSGTGE